MAAFTSRQLKQLVEDFAASAEQAREILYDSDSQMPADARDEIHSDSSRLSDLAAELAVRGVNAEFSDADVAFTSVHNAVQTANITISRLRGTSRGVGEIANILSRLVSLGIACHRGDAAEILNDVRSVSFAASLPVEPGTLEG